ncbi:hypothetical protein SAMN05444008_111152 [Cnuella takakiae]|uniref:Uncharacterized protein n=2 Tax=Cnuella takakiae TaxID=1302690 RepID=A0A1M5E0M7_9BACT|nr:hypothetical protein BUE76_19465 [Cnuella takakiae]SHF72601.1 hypothetical protein SAMN05444008_111152 [Cnuella takakiae]
MVSAGGNVVLLCTLLNAIVLEQGFIAHHSNYKGMFISLPLLLCSLVLLRGKGRMEATPVFKSSNT